MANEALELRLAKYRQDGTILLLIDYDGTIVPLASQPEEHRLQDLVRTVNIARSLRGIQREHPEVVAFREEFTKEMNTLIASSEVEISW